MFIIKDSKEIIEGIWFDFTLWGEKVRLKIRPRFESIVEKIRKKHPKNERAILNELWDYIIEDFEGFGDESGIPFEVNIENKRKIMNIPSPAGEPDIATYVLDRANELAIEIRETERKN